MKKRCSYCKRLYPATREYFYAARGSLHIWCKVCVRKDNREYKARSLSTTQGYLRRVFSQMKQRCQNPNDKAYSRYGGRGIKVLFSSADEFIDYVMNVLMVEPRGLTIDRVDNDGHYEKGNIRFVTLRENLRNRNISNYEL